VLEALDPVERQRQEVLFELVSTEVAYVTDLNTITTVCWILFEEETRVNESLLTSLLLLAGHSRAYPQERTIDEGGNRKGFLEPRGDRAHQYQFCKGATEASRKLHRKRSRRSAVRKRTFLSHLFVVLSTCSFIHTYEHSPQRMFLVIIVSGGSFEALRHLL